MARLLTWMLSDRRFWARRAPVRRPSASSSAGTTASPRRPGRTRARRGGSGGCTPTAARNSASRSKQSKKIDEVWEATAPKQREKWHEIEKLEEALAQTIKENTADVAIVAQQVEKVEKLRAENTAARTVMLYRMRLLLTPEQRVKVDEMRARMDAERKKQEEERKRQGRGDKQ